MNVNEVVKSKTRIYEGSYLSFERWEVILPDNSTAIREIVIPRDAVAIVAVDQHRQIHLVRHSRVAVNAVLVEIPAGLIDENESPEDAACRELVEEIGLYPKNLQHLLTYYHAEGYSTGKISIFLATDLEPRKESETDHKEFLEHLEIPFEEVLTWIPLEKIKDSKTLLGVMLAKERLR